MVRLNDLIEEACRVLAQEEAGRLDGLRREGALLTLDSSPTVVVGDLHGDSDALEIILKGSGILDKLRGGWRLVFLGDYADRGPDPLGIYERVLGLKVSHPGDVVLMKGNHEALDITPFQPHDLPDRLRETQGSGWEATYGSLLRLQTLLPSAAIYGGRDLLIHGGIFPGMTRRSLVRPSHREMEMMLWNDPYEDAEGITASPRGAGVRFGPAVTREVLGDLGADHLVRSHSAVPGGYRFSHMGRVLTIFSAKHVYGLEGGAYLVLEGGRSLGDGIRVF